MVTNDEYKGVGQDRVAAGVFLRKCTEVGFRETGIIPLVLSYNIPVERLIISGSE